MPEYVVKFVPWNEYTISNLINKKIRFSTVFDFNDFNELHYIGGGKAICDDEKYQSEWRRLIQKFVEDKTLILKLISNLENTNYKPEYISKLREILISEKLDNAGNILKELSNYEHMDRMLEENIAYNVVGVFCCSDIGVFIPKHEPSEVCQVIEEDKSIICEVLGEHPDYSYKTLSIGDNAPIMFAHYAKNLSGVALIYEVLPVCEIVDMKYRFTMPGSEGLAERACDWMNGEFDNVNDFLNKSKSWEYEKERRIFNKPGNKEAEACGLKLSAVFHTRRFEKQNLATLNEINKAIYNEGLLVRECIQNSCGYNFVIMDDEKMTVCEWIEQNLYKK